LLLTRSAAAMIDPFITMWHEWAKEAGSRERRLGDDGLFDQLVNPTARTP
jgi:hypothetical protein